jgi:hypothetical protein
VKYPDYCRGVCEDDGKSSSATVRKHTNIAVEGVYCTWKKIDRCVREARGVETNSPRRVLSRKK